MSLNTNEWLTEAYENRTAFSVKYDKILFDRQSPFQRVQVYRTEPMGNVLTLNGCFMVTDKDAFAYHEMLVHPAVSLCADARRVLVIGGGDAGAVTELVKYPRLESVTLCEIDAAVVEACREHFPEVSAGLNDRRLSIAYEDGAELVKRNPEEYDVIIVDSTDPVGPAEALYQVPFYESVLAALRSGGIAVFQTESPYFMPDVVSDATAKLASVFGTERVFTYLGVVPCYPGALWSFTMCSKDSVSPEAVRKAPDRAEVPVGLKYYSPEVHAASFALPPFVRDLVSGT
jgi:spermidine synthase